MGAANAPDRLGRRILAFAGLPFLSLVTPFFFLPILARVAGPDGWLAIAVGQSIGGFFALVIALGYNTVGPAMVALSAPADRAHILAVSLHARVLVWLPSAVAAAAIAVAVAPPSHRLESASMALAMSLTGLSASWFMIGLGRAGYIALYEIAPRMLATVIAAVIVLNLGPVMWYPVLLTLAALVSILWFAAHTVGFRALLSGRWAETVAVLRANRSAVATEVAAGAYNSLAVTFVSSTASAAQAASYVSGDKLYRIGQYSVSALGNALQGWTVEQGSADFGRRIRRSLVLHLILGLFGFAAFALFGPALSSVLFGASVAIDLPTALGLGLATVGIALGTALGRITLVGMGARKAFFISVLLGAAVGVPAILVLSSVYGAAGGAWGLACGEFVSVASQAFSVWYLRRAAGSFVVGQVAAAATTVAPPE